MSQSMCVCCFRLQDEEYHKMRAVWDACKAAGVPPPIRVAAFFDGREPAAYGREIALPQEALTPYADSMRDGFDIDVTKLPAGVKIVRVYNSY